LTFTIEWANKRRAQKEDPLHVDACSSDTQLRWHIFIKPTYTTSEEPRMAMVTDPVCGMEVDSDKASAFTAYGLLVYYFCSQDCKEEFETHTEKYVGDASIVAGTAAIPEDQRTQKPG
jgi:Cu+-exporting ATPase